MVPNGRRRNGHSHDGAIGLAGFLILGLGVVRKVMMRVYSPIFKEAKQQMKLEEYKMEKEEMAKR